MIKHLVCFRCTIIAGLLCVVVLAGLFVGGSAPKRIWAAYQDGIGFDALKISYPLDGTLFPPEIIAPTFRWDDKLSQVDAWLVWFEFDEEEDGFGFVVSEKRWTPSDDQWDLIKLRSMELGTKVSVVGFNQASPKKILSAGSITISTSKDEVGAPIFYREVNLPFIEAVTDPTKIRWRFGEVSSKTQPPIIMEKLPVCGNCHSFSADGTDLGMDVDYANDKGSYAIVPVAEDMLLDKDDIITWSDYKREDEKHTFGLLSQVSPDGRYVISTVKDRSVFVARPDLAYSQLFFPIRGILAVYDRETKEFHSLPGADDPRFVQSNVSWSPDGKTIIFARAKAHPLKTIGNDVLLTEAECREFLKEGKTFKFDLYQIPFNEGKGGKAEPVKGASKNGMSNYFAKYSPDGKWIVFCKAKSFMLLQPGSDLYIIPVGGGEARRMKCNVSEMNSWHSWSPNSRWMVFSSKANGPYTQLWLTHIDEEGQSTPPLVLSHFTSPNMAANIPEFVNIEPAAIKVIRQNFLDDYSFVRAGEEFLKSGVFDGAAKRFLKAIELNPNNSDAYTGFGTTLVANGRQPESVKYYRKAIELNSENDTAHNNLGMVLSRQGKIKEAEMCFKRACEIDGDKALYHANFGNTLMRLGKTSEAVVQFRKALSLNPNDLMVINAQAWILATCPDDGVRDGNMAVKLAEGACKATGYKDPRLVDTLGAAYAEAGDFSKAINAATKAKKLLDPRQKEIAEEIQRRIELYKAGKPERQK